MYYTSKEVYEFISTQTNDPIVEWKTCRVSWTEFPIFQSDLDFYKKISPKFGEQTFDIPTPTLCPEERQRRRLMFRNERKLYKRKCDATGENIISIYSPDKPYKVYKQDFRWSDKRDPTQYWFEFDFSKNFTEQFGKLILEVPTLPLFATKNENSEYVNWAEQNKNCYLIFVSDHNEESYFSDTINYCKNITDCLSCYNMNNCSNCIWSEWCNNSKNLIDCKKTNNSEYCNNCNDIDNCLFCINLINKQYCIFNKQFDKETYIKNKNNILNNNKYINKYNIFLKQIKNQTTNILQSNLSYWNNLYSCKNVLSLFEWYESLDCKYWIHCNKIQDCNDTYVVVDNSNLCYESVSTISTYKSSFTYSCWHNNKEIFYCQFCMNSSYLFGCVWLRNKQYCIFNKQYTKEEYFEITKKIIWHMIKIWERWEFFDPSLSPFGYNETVAQEYFPISENDAKQKWYKRQGKNYDPVIPEHVQTLKWDQIPADISQVSDDILKKILVCEVSWRPFRIIKQELDFYKKHNLPLPRKHPDIRHEERLKQRPPRELHLRNCDKCWKQMISVYDEGFDGTVYCEECYKDEVYW